MVYMKGIPITIVLHRLYVLILRITGGRVKIFLSWGNSHFIMSSLKGRRLLLGMDTFETNFCIWKFILLHHSYQTHIIIMLEFIFIGEAS